MVFSKTTIVYALTFAALLISTNSTFGSMDPEKQNSLKKGRLYFQLDDERKIESAFSYKMNYGIPPKDFLDKDIVDVLPESEREKMIEKFNEAASKKKRVYAAYTLGTYSLGEQRSFIAKIIPFVNQSAGAFLPNLIPTELIGYTVIVKADLQD